MATRDELDIPMPAMTPSYRTGLSKRPSTMDRATRRLAVFAGVIGGALLLLVGVWSFTGHRRTEVPVVEAPAGPVRVKPADPGGLKIDGASDSAGDASANSTAAPAPEIPAPQALKEIDKPMASPAAASPAATPAPALGAPSVAVASAKPVMTVRPQLQPLPNKSPHITVVAPIKPGTLASTGTTSVLAPQAGAALVQLAALESEPAAMTEWQRLSRKYPELLDGRKPTVTRTEHGGKVYWRLRTGGFADLSQATNFCERVKSKGGGCSVADF